MSLFSNSRRSHSLSRQIEDLRDELSDLAEAMSEQGSAAFKKTGRQASHLYDDISDSLSHAMPALKRSKRRLSREVKRNPAPAAAAVGLVLVGIALAAYFGRR